MYTMYAQFNDIDLIMTEIKSKLNYRNMYQIDISGTESRSFSHIQGSYTIWLLNHFYYHSLYLINLFDTVCACTGFRSIVNHE